MRKNTKTTVKKETKSNKINKPVKMNVQIQYNYHDVSLDDIQNKVIHHLIKLGIKKTSILTLEIYYKAELNEIFYFAKTKDNKIIKNEEPLII